MRTFSLAALMALFLVIFPSPVLAQSPQPVQASPEATIATDTADLSQATFSAGVASPAALVEQTIEQRRGSDITEPAGQVKSRLARVLDDNPIQSLNITNFVQHGIRWAVNQGVPANVLVLILLFPVIASLIAASRHIIGLEGFGVYAPAVLSVALLSTGILTGVLMFTVVIFIVSLGRGFVKQFKLQYLPRTALLLWFVSLGVFGLMLASPYLITIGIDLVAVTIFPILVLILLSENFMEVTFSSTQSRAIELTLETIILAVISALIMRTQTVQDFVILNPELTIAGVFILDILVGRYTGLRVSEYFRFKPILDPEEEEGDAC